MANTSPFEKGVHNDPWYLSVKCASAITDTKLAYKLSTTDHETCELCGDNEAIAGFPDRRLTAAEAAAGVVVNLRMAGHLQGQSSGAGVLAINDPITSAAAGQLHKAVIGTDLVQGIAESPATNVAGTVFTIRKGA